MGEARSLEQHHTDTTNQFREFAGTPQGEKTYNEFSRVSGDHLVQALLETMMD